MSEAAGTPAVPEWDVADRLRKSLRVAGIGVAEMADYLGVSRTSVSNWINGRIAPSIQTLRLWALRCGVSYPWLLSGEAQPLPFGNGFRSERSLFSLARLLTLSAA
jgi:transcriptional regulator with XRE-family HTH domain